MAAAGGAAAKKTASGAPTKRQVAKDAVKTNVAMGGPDNPEANEATAAQIASQRRASKESGKQGRGEPGADAPKKGEPSKGEPSKGEPSKDKRGYATFKGDSKRKGAPKLVAWAWSGNRRILTAQFIACVVIVGLGTLTAPQGSKDDVTRMMVKFSALSGLFFILALVSSGGTGAAKVSTALGTLVTTAYVVTSSDAHNVVSWVASFFRKPTGEGAGEPVGPGTMTPGGGGTGEPLTGGEGAGVAL